jgi:hypothetical protein
MQDVMYEVKFLENPEKNLYGEIICQIGKIQEFENGQKKNSDLVIVDTIFHHIGNYQIQLN